MKEEKPVSRIWACVFAWGFLALLWTQKMQKTRKWIMIIVPIYLYGHTIDSAPDFINEEFSILLLVVLIILLIIPIYFMAKWTKEYNLNRFSINTTTNTTNEQTSKDEK